MSLGRVSHKYRLLINANKTKIMASDGIACCKPKCGNISETVQDRDVVTTDY